MALNKPQPTCSSCVFQVLTPEGHEDGEEDSGWVVEEIGDLGEEARASQLPVLAQFVAQRTHDHRAAAYFHAETYQDGGHLTM